VILVLILAIAVLAGFFVFPGAFGNKFLPWKLGLDLVGGAHLIYEIDTSQILENDRESVVEGLRDVIERRVNLFGVSEPQVFTAQSGNSDRLIVELAGIKDVSLAIQEIGATPFLLFAEVVNFPNDLTGTTTLTQDNFIPTELTGRYVIGAALTFDNITSQSQVNLSFNDEGAELFEKITEANIGKPLAVFLDNQLITAPIVQAKISGGQAQITGNFTLNEARALVSRFNAGALPAPIKLIGQQTVGASLGEDSLSQTIFAGTIGTILIILFMIVYYRGFGFFAAIALIIYILLTLLIFKLLSITFTLAGIAGIILSIGMAVDANILIFERTKEEIKKGVAKLPAVEEGFKRAWLSIRDSNITTIMTSVILYYITTGFVRGFALALLIGVVISMFSAITVTRTMLRVFTKNL